MKNKVFLDIETDSLNPTVIHVVCTHDDRWGTRYWRDKETFHKFISNFDHFIGHNIISFDAPVLNKLWDCNININNITDTLILSQLFNPQRKNGHSLDSWGVRFDMLKGNFSDFSKYSEEMLEYCLQDLKITVKLYNYFINEEQKDFSNKCIRLEHEIGHIINKQINHGFYLNQKKAIDLLGEIKEKINEIEKEIIDHFKPVPKFIREVYPKYNKDGSLSIVGLKSLDDWKQVIGEFSLFEWEEFNLGSPKQIIKRIEKYGWKPTQLTPKGQPQITEKNLNTIDSSAPEGVKRLAEWKMLQTRITTIESWLDHVDCKGFVHGQVYPLRAVTGRMTHSDPNMANVIANWKPYGYECRSCWTVPSDDYVLVGMDAKGLELRMLAHYMRDKAFTEAVISGDPHSFNQEMAGLNTRDEAKRFIYALIYGAGDLKIGSIINGSAKDGKDIKRRYYSRLPNLERVMKAASKSAKRGYIRGLDGRRLFIRSPHAALNTLLQGGGAIVCKQWSIFLDKEIRKRNLDAYLVNTVHDEQQYQVHIKDAGKVALLADPCIAKVKTEFGMRVPLAANSQIGKTWAETH